MIPTESRRPWLPAAVLLAAALAVVPAAMAASPAYPFRAKVSGVKPKDWVVQWWQWAYGTPDTVDAPSPLFDETGAYVAIGQRGNVWFLCGAYNGTGTVTRNVVIPEGKALFFPIFTQEFDNVGAGSPKTSEELYLDAAAFAGTVDLQGLFCTVGGVALTDLYKRRVVSPVFAYAVGPGTLPLGFGAAEGDVVSPVVSDGYWVMLKALPVGGPHVLHFGGNTTGPSGYVQDVTYNITVVATE